MLVPFVFVPDTGGRGEYRGCLSVVRQYRFLDYVGILSYRPDRQDYLPFGLADGKEGTASITLLNPGTPNEKLLPGKTTRRIRSGDVIRHVTAGGGYGPAESRDVDRINADLCNEKFSAEFVGHTIGRIS